MRHQGAHQGRPYAIVSFFVGARATPSRYARTAVSPGTAAKPALLA